MKNIYTIAVFTILTLLVSCEKPPVIEGWSINPSNTAQGKKEMVIVFDGSGSMADDNKLGQAKEALKLYIKALPEEVSVGIVLFYNSEIIELQKINTGNRDALKNSIDSIKAGGFTPLGKSIHLAYKMLSEKAVTNNHTGEYHLVVVTDGKASDSITMDHVVSEIISKTPIRIFTIGFRISEDHPLNRSLARYVSADNQEQISKGLKQVLAEKEE